MNRNTVIAICFFGLYSFAMWKVFGQNQKKVLVLKAFHNGTPLLVVRGINGQLPTYPAEGFPLVSEIQGIDQIIVEEEK